MVGSDTDSIDDLEELNPKTHLQIDQADVVGLETDSTEDLELSATREIMMDSGDRLESNFTVDLDDLNSMKDAELDELDTGGSGSDTTVQLDDTKMVVEDEVPESCRVMMRLKLISE